MVLCLLPVLPPELRPMIQIDGDKLMSSDLNELYRRVIFRNNYLTTLLTNKYTPVDLIMGQEKLVQQAVDTLLDNGIRGQPIRDGHNKVYKSFSDFIQGKEGRFRKTLLGKRVDYSGRSVIVVGPSLSLHQCGLPREIAIELFQTFVIGRLACAIIDLTIPGNSTLLVIIIVVLCTFSRTQQFLLFLIQIPYIFFCTPLFLIYVIAQSGRLIPRCALFAYSLKSYFEAKKTSCPIPLSSSPTLPAVRMS